MACCCLAPGDTALEVNSGGRGPVSAEWMIGKALWIKQNEPQLYEVSARGLGGLGWAGLQLGQVSQLGPQSAAMRLTPTCKVSPGSTGQQRLVRSEQSQMWTLLQTPAATVLHRQRLLLTL